MEDLCIGLNKISDDWIAEGVCDDVDITEDGVNDKYLSLPRYRLSVGGDRIADVFGAKNYFRLRALWNMAERVGLSSDEISRLANADKDLFIELFENQYLRSFMKK